MDDDDLRDEYIMNDQGRVYKGMSIAIKHTPWNYAQVIDYMLYNNKICYCVLVYHIIFTKIALIVDVFLFSFDINNCCSLFSFDIKQLLYFV